MQTMEAYLHILAEEARKVNSNLTISICITYSI